MVKKFLFLIVICVLTSGCYMVPLAFVGPATSSFSTASVIQSSLSTSANYLVKKSTGKHISEHVIEAFDDNMQNSYLPNQVMKNKYKQLLPKNRPNIN